VSFVTYIDVVVSNDVTQTRRSELRSARYHGGEHEDGCLMEYCAVESSKNLPTFQT
jgi:hypothetical protein